MQSISALDALIQYLVEEISMDGDAGTDISRLDNFVSDFYSPHRSSSSSTSSISPPLQNVDETFLSFVWNILIEQDDLNIGTIQAINNNDDSEHEGSNNGDQKPQIDKGKGKKKAVATSSHALVALSKEEVQLGRRALKEKHGENLRIMATPDVAWTALTTSHIRLKTITPVVYSIIQLVAREKGIGATTVQVGTAIGIDQKAAFHYVRAAVNAGAIKKFRVIADGTTTSRLIHTRYLSISNEWKMHLLRENEEESEAEAGGDGSGDDNPQPSSRNGPMFPISTEYLTTNTPLIESRIVRAIKMEKSKMLMHRAVAMTIGLRNPHRVDLRRLRTVIHKLCAANLIERVLVTTTNGGDQTMFLRIPAKVKQADVEEVEEEEVEEEDEEEDEEAQQPHALWNLNIERQIFDLLAAADDQGLALKDIRTALAGLNVRVIESILSKFERSGPPTHLADFSLHSVTENIGREKRTRYFLLSGFLRRCEKDNFPNGGLGFDPDTLEAVGDWSAIESTGFYQDERDLVRWEKKNIKSAVQAAGKAKEPRRKSATGGRAKSSSTPAPKKVKTPAQIELAEKRAAAKADKEAKKLQKAEAKWIADGNEGPYVVPEKDPSELNYYERTKLAAAERAKQGLPPPPKRSAKLGGRRSKAVLAEIALAKAEGTEPVFEGEDNVSPSKEGTPIASGSNDKEPIISPLPSSSSPTKSKARPRAKKSVVAPPTPPSAEVEVTESAASPLIAAVDREVEVEAPKKGKGRASTSKKVVEKEKEKVEEPVQPVKEIDQLEEEVVIPPTPVSKKKGKAPKASTLKASTAKDSSPPAAAIVVNEDTPVATSIIASGSETPAIRGPSRRSTTSRVELSTPLPSPIVKSKKRSTIPQPSVEVEPPSRPTSSVIKRRPEMELEVVIDNTPLKRVRIGEPGESGSAPPSAKQIPALEPQTSASQMDIDSPSAASTSVTQDIKPPRTKPKKNLTALRRQNDILAYVHHQGGIIVQENRLGPYIKAYFDEQEALKNEEDRAPVFVIDRRNITTALDSLVSSNLLRSTVVVAEDPKNRLDLYYLPSIAIDSPQMNEFREAATTRTNFKPIHQDVPVEIRLSTAFPSTSDDFETIRDYFCGDKKVLSSQYGVYYGRFARARAVHQFMVDFATSKGTENGFVFKRTGEDNLILAHLALYSEMPLHTALRIWPIPSISPDLDNYLAQPGNSQVVCKDLPPNVFAVVGVEFAKRSTISAIMQYLCDLNLVRPLVVGTSSEFETPEGIGKTTHWELLPIAPLYAFGIRQGEPLISVLPIDTSETAREYWAQLEANAMYRAPTPTAVVPLHHPTFPAYYQNAVNIRLRNIITNYNTWFDQYFLRRSQIKMLEHYIRDNIPLDHEFLTKLASALLATFDSVSAKYQELLTAPPGSTEKSSKKEKKKKKDKKDKVKKRSSKRRKVGGDEEADENEEEEESVEDIKKGKNKSALSMKQTLGRKAKEEVAQRQKDFNSILERFKRDVGEPQAPEGVLEFLRSRFCSNNRLLGANKLDSELRLLLPNSQDVIQDVNYQSIIPASLFHVEVVDPYALPRRITHKPARKERGVARPLPSVPVGDYNPGEFLSTPIVPPVLGQGQRLPRHFWTADQDELILDVAAIIKTRATYINKVISWAPIEALFPGLGSNKMRTHFLQLVSKVEEQVYHERLQEAWMNVWNEKRGSAELPDPKPDSTREFDILPFVRSLRANVDKQALRLVGPVSVAPVKVLSDIISLPSSFEELHSVYKIEAASGTITDAKFGAYWKNGIGNLARENIISGIAFSAPYDVSNSDINSVDQDLALAIATLKMVLVTPNAIYDESMAQALLRPFEAQLRDAIDILTKNGVLAKHRSETTRRLPGRGFVITDKYLNNFDNLINVGLNGDAEKQIGEIIKGEEDEWPLDVRDGSIAALLYLVNEGSVDLSIDLSVLDDIRDPNDYETRKANDEHIESCINYSYNGDAPPLVPLTPSVWPNAAITDGVESLSQIALLSSTRSPVDTSVLPKLWESIRQAGSSGITRSQLSNNLKPENISSHDLGSLLETLLTAKPPLVFWAGYNIPVLVASEHLSKWTIVISTPLAPVIEPTPISKKGKGKGKAMEKNIVAEEVMGEVRLLPVLWLDMKGQVVPDLWIQATTWLKGTLLTYAGSTAAQLASKGRHGLVITLMEVMIILEAFEKAGYVEKRVPEGFYDGGDKEGTIAWDLAMWYPTKWLRG